MKKIIGVLAMMMAMSGYSADKFPASGEIRLKASPKSGHLQDVCTDGAGHLFWAHTGDMYKTDMDGNVLAHAGVGDHHAGIEVRDGKAYVAICSWKKPWDQPLLVGEFDAETLKTIAMHDTGVKDRAGSLAILEDGTFLVGCLRPRNITYTQVRFHHIGRDFKLIKSHVIDNVPVLLGIEVLRKRGDSLYLFCYGMDKNRKKLPFDTIRLDKSCRETWRGKVPGANIGIVFDGDDVWTAFTRKDKKTGGFDSRLRKLPKSKIPVGFL